MEYQTILTIKESEKATVELAAVELFVGPVIVKRLKGGKPDIYRVLSLEKNPHIPQIYAIEELDGELLIAEEYVDGESLGEHLQKGLLSDEQKLTYALQLCEAVGFLHALKPTVLHRDIKPSNILINGKGVLKLIDFDASRQYKATPSSSDTRLLGTVEYAPPEQFGYSQTDVRSDIYSMGVVFHEMRPTESKKLAKQWEKITEKCTSFDPKNRYQSVAELKRELEKLVAWKKRRKHKIEAWIGGVAALLVVAMLVVVLWPKKESTENVGGAKLTGVPTSVPIDAPTPTLEEEQQKRIDEIVAGLEAQSFYIDTFHKGLDTGADFMQYSTYYEGKEVVFQAIMMQDLVTQERFFIPKESFYNENNVLHIRNSYLKELPESCYRVEVEYADSATGRSGTMGTHLMISKDAEVAQDAMLFDNNFLDFYYEYDDCVHTILANDIVGQFVEDEYCLLENGRVIEFPSEYLMNFITPGESKIVYFDLQLKDGRSQILKIQYLTGKPPYAK